MPNKCVSQVDVEPAGIGSEPGMRAKRIRIVLLFRLHVRASLSHLPEPTPRLIHVPDKTLGEIMLQASQPVGEYE